MSETFPKQGRYVMRWIHIGLIAAFVAMMMTFPLKNLASVTMSFLDFRISVPLAVVAVVVYVLGMATGWSLWALIRWAWEGRKGSSSPT
jgi:Na+/H+-dicarboxylate symporter